MSKHVNILTYEKGRGDNVVIGCVSLFHHAAWSLTTERPITVCLCWEAPVCMMSESTVHLVNINKSQHLTERAVVSHSKQMGVLQWHDNTWWNYNKPHGQHSPWVLAHWQLGVWSVLLSGRIGSVRALLSDRLLRISRACFPFVASNWPMSGQQKL